MATWYFKESTNRNWETLGNWWSNSGGTGSHPDAIPWATAASKDYNLSVVTGYTGSPPLIGGPDNWVISGPPIGTPTDLGNGFTITGTCDINHLIIGYKCYIRGGTWDGDDITSTWSDSGETILGGTWNGDRMIINTSITGGTFYGDGMIINATITGGTFYGDDYQFNSSDIYGGTFYGDNWTFWYGSHPFNRYVVFYGNGAFNMSISIVLGGTFHGEVIFYNFEDAAIRTPNAAGGHGPVFYERWSPDGGVSWFYPATSSYVNKPADIRKGVTIADTVTGTAEVPTAAQTVTGAKTSTAGVASVDGTYPPNGSQEANAVNLTAGIFLRSYGTDT